MYWFKTIIPDKLKMSILIKIIIIFKTFLHTSKKLATIF